MNQMIIHLMKKEQRECCICVRSLEIYNLESKGQGYLNKTFKELKEKNLVNILGEVTEGKRGTERA